MEIDTKGKKRRREEDRNMMREPRETEGINNEKRIKTKNYDKREETEERNQAEESQMNNEEPSTQLKTMKSKDGLDEMDMDKAFEEEDEKKIETVAVRIESDKWRKKNNPGTKVEVGGKKVKD